MRILHTADLHLGRQFNGISLEPDQQAVLDQILTALHERAADVLLIAGDVFDRPSPPATAVRQFNAFLSRVASETEAAVVLIAGNHDSGDRIEAMAVLTDRRRALIRGTLAADERPLLLADTHGAVAFSALPFAYEYAARECFGDETIQSPEDVLSAQLASARRHLPEGARWIVAAHAFVAGATGSDSERPLARVGTIETVRAETFRGAHYVALGHLHRPQHVGAPHIRYSGSPLAFGFDEAGQEKSMTLVEMDAAGAVTVEMLPFRPLHQVRILRGRHAELMLAEPSGDFIKARLLDEVPVIDAMKRLRSLFPNACELGYEREERAAALLDVGQHAPRAVEPMEVLQDFLALLREEPLSEAEREVLTQALNRIGEKEEGR
ncbi:exonuclease SbcCD subunit D [Rhodobacter sp. NSM]|uniref:exonuclease SbcCD subunit D n=1 Tax=Rhodobacter sp. NSM TaxID=3457501 RepID=UPI003FD05A27